MYIRVVQNCSGIININGDVASCHKLKFGQDIKKYILHQNFLVHFNILFWTFVWTHVFDDYVLFRCLISEK